MMHWFVVLICVLYIYIYLSVCGCIYIYKYIDNYQIIYIYISYDFDMSWYIHATCSWNLVNRLRSIINFKPLTTWMGWWRMHLVPEDLLRCGLEKRTNRDSGCRLCWCLAATCLLSAIVPARFGDLHSTVAHCFEDALKCCWSRAALVEDQQNKNNQKQSKTVCSTLGVFGMVSNFPSSSQGQFPHWGIQSTLSFALNPSGLLPLNLLYTSPFCCPWPNQRRVQKHHFEKQKIFGFKGLHAFLYTCFLAPAAWLQHE